jgi:hypothetical protein
MVPSIIHAGSLNDQGKKKREKRENAEENPHFPVSGS